ncbi:HEPN domain-containing protein [Hephaestia sp. GCM10023244]|uniref:HEPN domain-containing protein n=1 Tax=unclassified Hephaestia TaxID=2631281 RepID=UPI002077461D|nr:HEPN domain-containing protein [Hephaestia sp. MAHUQ-44]MCM8732393.1 HEPN domain-containing protein [Hephaestia sp. MAHUQ-44]
MKTGLDHLPPQKKQEIDRILRLVFEEFEDALSLARHEWKTAGKILKVILYGSHARGDWSYEPGSRVGKNSDWDLLIIVNDERLTDYMAYWSNLAKRFRVEFEHTHRLLSPVQFIVHSLDEVNDALSHGRYFFIDIARDGVALYEADETPLAEPRPKSPTEASSAARDYFETWFTKATEFFDTYRFSEERGRYDNGAIQLHQCVERLYQTVLLVCTFYTPYIHDLVKLRGQAELVDARLQAAWPRQNSTDVDAFEKLQEAYVKARYIKDFDIGAEQLAWLGERTEVLMDLARSVCEERLAALEAAAS